MRSMQRWTATATAWFAGRTGRLRAALVALVVVALAGAAIRLHGFVERPIWEDEAYTWKDCQIPFWRLVWWKHDPAHGPASHVLVRLSMELFGTDEVWALRLPSLVCGILCVPAAFYLGRTIHGDALGLTTATLVAVDPNMVDQSQQARMYTMLALISMLVLIQAVRLLRAPAATRGPWIVLGVLLAAQLWINFGALALWLGLAVTFGIVAIYARRAGGDAAVRGRLLARGALVAYAWAVLLGARGLWRFYIFVRADRGIASTTTGDTLEAMGRGFEQLTGTGEFAVVVLAAVLLGLVLLARRDPAVALALIATAVATLAMIYAGRSVHHMVAVRYFTVLQPAIWLALAALPVFATTLPRRVVLGASLAALGAVELWQATHVDRWVDVNTWRYARAAAQFIQQSRADGDLVVCTPAVNFGAVARYYELSGPADDALQRRMAEGVIDPAHLVDETVWVIAYMFDPRSERALQTLLDDTQWRERSAAERQRIVASVRESGLTVVRLSAGRCDSWVYDAAKDGFAPLTTIVAQGSVVPTTATRQSAADAAD